MQTQQMDEKQWAIAHDIAFELVERGTDPNELSKVIAFMRRARDDDNAKDRLMSLVQRMADSRNALIRSRQTQRFYRNIKEACQQHLRSINEAEELLHILGWSLRLIHYYRAEPKRAAEEQQVPRPTKGQQKTPQQRRRVQKLKPTQTPKPPTQPEKPKFKVGDKVNATILKKDGMKVKVLLQTDDKEEVVFERPYYPGLVGARIKVRVQAVNASGQVTQVIP